MSQWIAWGYFIVTVLITVVCIFWLEYTRIRGLGLDGRPEAPQKQVQKADSQKSKKKEMAEAGKEN